MKVLKFCLWILAWPFLSIWLLLEFKSCYVAGRRYKKDPTSSTQEERYMKVGKLVRHFLYWKRIKINICGKEKNENKVMLYIANHKSNIDPLVLLKTILDQETIPKITFVAKEELKETKIGKIADLLDVIYINRQNIRQIPNVLDEMVKTLQTKKTSICLFPEATRVHGDNFNDFNATLIDCVYQTNLSIQPTVIYNSNGMIEKNDHKPIDKTIDVCFMPIINSDKFININRNIFMKNLQTQMFEQYQKMKNNHGKN